MKKRYLFGIIFLLGAFFNCAKTIPPSEHQGTFPHDKESWLQWRSEAGQLDLQAAADLDLQWDAQHKPENYGAPYQREEGRALWQKHCALCHGPAGKGNPQKYDPPPRKFGGMGMTMGFFFGGDKMRAAIFHKIKTGQALKKKENSRMAGNGELLHNEQIWALVLHLENL